MSEEVAQDQSCRHQSPLNATDQLWNTESHACLDKHLSDPHYYTPIKRKSDVSLSLQMRRRTLKQPLYPKNAGNLKHQNHCSEVPTVTQELWWEHEKKTDTILHLPRWWTCLQDKVLAPVTAEWLHTFWDVLPTCGPTCRMLATSTAKPKSRTEYLQA